MALRARRGVARSWFASALVLLACRAKPIDDVEDCTPRDGVEWIATVPSPSGQRAAILLRTNGGATTAFGAQVCVEENGRRRSIAVGYRSNDTRVRWASETVVVIEGLSDGRPTRTVDVTSGVIVCEPVRADWNFCEQDGTRRR